MKIIHTADIHLDSPLSGVADSKLRRAELLRALSFLADFADNEGVSAVVVAGDLFDDKFATPKTVESVAQIINGNKAQWFVVQGNHGDDTPYVLLKKLCPKVNLFGQQWQTYKVGDVTFTGRELGNNDEEQWKALSVPKGGYNVLVLHGDIDSPAYGLIDKKAIAASGIDYVALGHRHSFAEHKFGKVRACYSGVLETRGFDESNDTGFVLLDTDTNAVCFKQQFIRRVETRTVDVSSVTTDLTLEKLVLQSVSDVSSKNYANVVFVGKREASLHVTDVAKRILQNKFFSLRIQDATTLNHDLEALSKEVSLRGEFVKLALELKDEVLRAKVLEMGLAALDGELGGAK